MTASRSGFSRAQGLALLVSAGVIGLQIGLGASSWQWVASATLLLAWTWAEIPFVARWFRAEESETDGDASTVTATSRQVTTVAAMEAMVDIVDVTRGMMREIRIDLERMQRLTRDAVETLDKSIEGLRNTLPHHAVLVQAVFASVAPKGSMTKVVGEDSTGHRALGESLELSSDDDLNHVMHRLSELDAEIAVDLAATTRSLQFEDIFRQLAQHSTACLDRGDQLFERILVTTGEPHRVPDGFDELRAVIDEFLRVSTNARPNAVSQESVSAGEFFLF